MHGMDFRYTRRNDIAKSDTGDVLTAQGRLLREQQIRMRLGLIRGEWLSDSRMGADLDTVRGQENNRQTGDDIRERIIYALTYDELFIEDELSVVVYPISREAVEISIEAVLEDGADPTVLRYQLDMQAGLQPL